MGIRGELFSTRFSCDGRTYFFNVKQNRNGDVFLSIVESKPSEGESFDRRSIVIFGEHMDEFLKSFQSALKFIDKTGIKVDPDPTARGYSAEEGGERRYKSEDARPRREASREGRGSSFKEEGGHEAKQATRRPGPRSGVPPERGPGRPAARGPGFSAEKGSGRSATRGSGASAERGPGRPVTRASSLSSARGQTDKPVKRIIVRKARKPGSED